MVEVCVASTHSTQHTRVRPWRAACAGLQPPPPPPPARRTCVQRPVHLIQVLAVHLRERAHATTHKQQRHTLASARWHACAWLAHPPVAASLHPVSAPPPPAPPHHITHTHTHAHVSRHTQTHIQRPRSTGPPPPQHTDTHAHAHTHAHARTHTHTHTHTSSAPHLHELVAAGRGAAVGRHPLAVHVLQRHARGDARAARIVRRHLLSGQQRQDARARAAACCPRCCCCCCCLRSGLLWPHVQQVQRCVRAHSNAALRPAQCNVQRWAGGVCRQRGQHLQLPRGCVQLQHAVLPPGALCCDRTQQQLVGHVGRCARAGG
jgi:hypothetical protein